MDKYIVSRGVTRVYNFITPNILPVQVLAKNLREAEKAFRMAGVIYDDIFKIQK